jgi:hypothetical protein
MAGPQNERKGSPTAKKSAPAKAAAGRSRSSAPPAAKRPRKSTTRGTTGKSAENKGASGPTPRKYRLTKPKSNDVDRSPVVSAEERERMIAEAAYFKAENRGFRDGDPIQDWIEAETEINAVLIGERVRRD